MELTHGSAVKSHDWLWSISPQCLDVAKLISRTMPPAVTLKEKNILAPCSFCILWLSASHVSK